MTKINNNITGNPKFITKLNEEVLAKANVGDYCLGKFDKEKGKGAIEMIVLLGEKKEVYERNITEFNFYFGEVIGEKFKIRKFSRNPDEIEYLRDFRERITDKPRVFEDIISSLYFPDLKISRIREQELYGHHLEEEHFMLAGVLIKAKELIENYLGVIQEREWLENTPNDIY